MGAGDELFEASSGDLRFEVFFAAGDVLLLAFDRRFTAANMFLIEDFLFVISFDASFSRYFKLVISRVTG